MQADTRTMIGEVLAASRYVLLDFDGLVCSIFAGRAASLVAEDVAAVIRSHGVVVAAAVLRRGDPLDVLRYAGRIGGRVVAEVEQTVQAAELVAAETATPAPGSAEFLNARRLTGRLVAIVSNNSRPAIAAYLDLAGIGWLVDHIEGRDPHDPALMKPHPASLERAIRALGGRRESSALIGDSNTDLQAARAAHPQHRLRQRTG